MRDTRDTFKNVLYLANLNVWEWNLKTKDLTLINTTFRQTLKDISPLMAAGEVTIPDYPQILIDRGIIKGNAINMVKEYETMIYNCENEEEVAFRLPFTNKYEKTVWIQFKGIIYLDEKGQPDHGVGFYTDISNQLDILNNGSVDSLMKMEIENQRFMRMIKGLTLEYSSLFLINLKDETYNTFRLDEISSSMIRDHLESKESYRDVMSYYIQQYVIEEDRERLQCLSNPEQIRSLLRDKGYFNINYRSYRNNEMVYCQVKVAMGNVAYDEIVIGFRNINEEIRQKEILEIASRQDSLTGLLNRKAFQSDVMQELFSGNVRNIGFLFIDLDHFKSVNDTLGHAMGDVAIAQTAEKLKAIFRKSDIIGRYGGDEFCLFIGNIPKELLIKRCERCLEDLKCTYTKLGKSVQISASIGVVYYPRYTQNNGKLLMEQADAAMYEAKKAGRDRYILKEYGGF